MPVISQQRNSRVEKLGRCELAAIFRRSALSCFDVHRVIITARKSLIFRSFERTTMRWKEGRRSDNVEDRRGVPAGVAIGGGIGTLIIVLIATFLGADPRQVVNLIQNNQQAAPNQGVPPSPATPPKKSGKSSSGSFWPTPRTFGTMSSRI